MTEITFLQLNFPSSIKLFSCLHLHEAHQGLEAGHPAAQGQQTSHQRGWKIWLGIFEANQLCPTQLATAETAETKQPKTELIMQGKII